MSLRPCSCPPTKGLTYEEIITSFGLLGRKNESKNCCEEAGYICPELSKALRKATRYTPQKDSNDPDQPKTSRRSKVLRKRELQL